MGRKECINCSKEFEFKSNKAKYCSDKCKGEYQYNNHKNHSLICIRCKTQFMSHRSDVEYCSKQCAGKSRQTGVLLKIEDVIEFVRNNEQTPLPSITSHFKTSNRTIYNLLNKYGYNSYIEFVGYVKGVYVEKMRSDTSVSAISCFEYCKELLNSDYKSEVFFDGLINPKTNKKLRVDCYFEELDIVVEYNGIQHYKHIPFYHSGKNTLDYQKYKDSLKEEYFRETNTKYIVIPYWYTKDEIKELFMSSQSAAELQGRLKKVQRLNCN